MKAVLSELYVQKVYIASEMKELSKPLYNALREMFQELKTEEKPHEDLKKLSCVSRAVIRTGGYQPYANIILESGVAFQQRKIVKALSKFVKFLT